MSAVPVSPLRPPRDGGPEPTAAALAAERARMEVDLDAVAENLETIRAAAGERAGAIAVLKGDGYGMGAVAVADRLAQLGVRRFATDNAAEAAALREAGIEGEILVFYGEATEHAGAYLDHGLTPTLYDLQGALACAAACAERDAELDVWLGVNVGFNRAGPREEGDFAQVAEVLRGARGLRVRGVLAHLTSSHLESSANRVEIEIFERRLSLARDRLGEELESSLFASHGLLRWGRDHSTDWVRPGLALVGLHCFDRAVLDAEDAAAEAVSRLRPAVALRARVIHLLDLPAGEGVGYAPRRAATASRRVATVALGFGSGFPTDGTPLDAILGGRPVPRVGPLGMDSLQVDVSEADRVSVGDWVTVAGRDGGSSIPFADLCAAAGLTPYQLLARLRLPRRYTSRNNPGR